MTYPTSVERWRGMVSLAVTNQLLSKPAYKALVNALGLTFDRLADTLLAIIQKESSGDPRAIGDNGNSIGLMQLNYGAGTPQSVGYQGTKDGLLDPQTNINLGVAYFFTRLEKYRDLDKAILAYNAGSYRVDAAGIPINEGYLKAIKQFAGFFLPRTSSSPLASYSPPSTSDAKQCGDAIPATRAGDAFNTKVVRIGTIIFFMGCLALSFIAFYCS